MNISLRGKENIFQQIVNEYKRLIELNIIQYDEKLPSCRILAQKLGINPNTVQRAYSVLEDEGYISILPKKGVYVCYKGKECNKFEKVKNIILDIKEEGISYNSLLEIIDDVYNDHD